MIIRQILYVVEKREKKQKKAPPVPPNPFETSKTNPKFDGKPPPPIPPNPHKPNESIQMIVQNSETKLSVPPKPRPRTKIFNNDEKF